MTAPCLLLALMTVGPAPVSAATLPAALAQTVSRNVCRIVGEVSVDNIGFVHRQHLTWEALDREGFHLAPSRVTRPVALYLPPPSFPACPLTYWARTPVTLIVRTLGRPNRVTLTLAEWDVFDQAAKVKTLKRYPMAQAGDGVWMFSTTRFWPGTVYRLSAEATRGAMTVRSAAVEIGVGNFYAYGFGAPAR